MFNDIANAEPEFPTTPAETESMHPVLAGLKSQIATLELSLENANETKQRFWLQKTQYEERVKNVLTEAMEDHDEETVRYIARNLDIKLTSVKSYEVNVTFTIEVETEMGEEVDPDWDFDFSVEHSDIQDFSSDVIWSKEV